MSEKIKNCLGLLDKEGKLNFLNELRNIQSYYEFIGASEYESYDDIENLIDKYLL